MQQMMSCWKRNEFKENTCQEEYLKYAECVASHQVCRWCQCPYYYWEALSIASVLCLSIWPSICLSDHPFQSSGTLLYGDIVSCRLQVNLCVIFSDYRQCTLYKKRKIWTKGSMPGTLTFIYWVCTFELQPVYSYNNQLQ